MASYYCPKCNLPYPAAFTTSGGGLASGVCQCPEETWTNSYTNYVQTLASQGWQCPLCRVVHAPWVQECECALPTLSDLKGIAPDMTGHESSEEFVRRIRDTS